MIVCFTRAAPGGAHQNEFIYKVIKQQTNPVIVNQPLPKPTFDVCPPNTNLQPSRNLTVLEGLETIDIFEWCKEVIETKRICNWTDEVTLTVIHTIVNSNLHYIIDNPQLRTKRSKSY